MTSSCGAAYYVAPEVLNRSYHEGCDIWSIGVLSFIMLCGYPPFAPLRGYNEHEILEKVKKGAFVFQPAEWDAISQGAKNIVSQMLTVDPLLRPSAQDLLASPWVRFTGDFLNPTPISADMVRQLQRFQSQSRLKKLALTRIARHLPDDAAKPLQDAFRHLDKNGRGTLSLEDMRDGLTKHGLAIPQRLEQILRDVDCSGSGVVDYTEWIAATIDSQTCAKECTCEGAFRDLDCDDDGRISREDLCKVLNGGQKNVTASAIDELFRECETDADDGMRFEDFLAMMKQGTLQLGESAPSSQYSAKRAKLGA